MNSGERNEYLLKFMLIQIRDGKVSIPGPFPVHSVGFGGIEYAPLPAGINVKQLVGYTDTQLIYLADSLGITKAPSIAKSDVQINGIGYSVKSHAASPPALVNHTPRPGLEFACIYSDVNIRELDPLIDEYWELREAGKIGEDVKNSSVLSPFRHHKTLLRDVLEYFLFTGTGSRISQYPAEFILEYGNALNPATWEVMNKEEAIVKLWDKLIFSIRSKGMPPNYPYNLNISKNDSISRWTRYSSGQYRGSLHVRSSR